MFFKVVNFSFVLSVSVVARKLWEMKSMFYIWKVQKKNFKSLNITTCAIVLQWVFHLFIQWDLSTVGSVFSTFCSNCWQKTKQKWNYSFEDTCIYHNSYYKAMPTGIVICIYLQIFAITSSKKIKNTLMQNFN